MCAFFFFSVLFELFFMSKRHTHFEKKMGKKKMKWWTACKKETGQSYTQARA